MIKCSASLEFYHFSSIVNKFINTWAFLYNIFLHANRKDLDLLSTNLQIDQSLAWSSKCEAIFKTWHDSKHNILNQFINLFVKKWMPVHEILILITYEASKKTQESLGRTSQSRAFHARIPKYEGYWRCRPKCMPLAPLDRHACRFKRDFTHMQYVTK